MQWLDVQGRIASGEDEKTEFKRGLGDFTAVGETLCALANTDGGLMVLGVDDSGIVVGVAEDPERVQERITGFLQSGLSSPITARLDRHQDPRGWVHWALVPRQRGFEPFRFRGRVWVRRGRATVEPSPTELQELYNAFGYILTEERYIEGSGVADIDLGAFRKYLSAMGLDTEIEPQPTADADLWNRGVIVGQGDETFASLYGILGFGKEPQRFPQTRSTWIECVAYEGTDRASAAVLVGEAKGRLDEQVQRAVGWLRGLGRVERYEGLVRTDIPLLPERVVREALVNAVVHRDYAITGSKVLLEVYTDRVELTSPGTLPNRMSAASVLAGGHPRSRNELMANLLLALGLMEQRGRGWPIMRRLMREFNGSRPTLEDNRDGRFVRVTLKLGPSPAEGGTVG